MSNNRVWTEDEFAVLREMGAAGKSRAEMAIAVGRTEKAVEGKLYQLGLFERVRTPRGAGQVVPVEEPSVSALERQQVRLNAPYRSLTAVYLGDPPVGFSALDRMRAEGKSI